MAKETMEVLDLTGLGIIQGLLKSMYIRQYVITTGTDWNTLTDTGIYHIKTTTPCTNCPTTNWGTLYVSGGKTVFQIWIPDTEAHVYKRYKSDTWNDWFELKSSNPNALTLQRNSTTIGTYDGSSALTFNITPSNIGAASSSHSHSNATTSKAGFLSATDKSKIDSMYKVTTITSATDWNTLTNTGIYHIMTTDCTNCPTTNWGTLYVNGEGTLFQIWIPDTSLDSIYKRYKSGGWSAWANLTSPDTGWQNITDFGSNIACASGYRCKYRRVGKVVDLHGVIVNSAAVDPLATSTFYTVFTLPSGYRPLYPMIYICGDLGSGKHWTMIVNSSGKVVIANYSGGKTVPINTYLSFDVTFLVVT